MEKLGTWLSSCAENKKRTKMDQKIILLIMCYIPAFLKGFLTYSDEINLGHNFAQAFQETFTIFIMLFAVGTLVALMLYPILKTDK